MKPEDKELLKTEILKYVQRENYDRNGVRSISVRYISDVAIAFQNKREAIRLLLDNTYGLLGNLLFKYARDYDQEIAKQITELDTKLIQDAYEKYGERFFRKADTWNVMKVLLKIDPNLVEKLDWFLVDKELAYEIAEYCPGIMKRVVSLKGDRDFTHRMVNTNPSCLEHASWRFKADRELVYEAVQRDPETIRFTDASLRGDMDLMMLAVRHRGLLLSYADEALKDNYEIVKAAVDNNGLALRFASDRLQHNIELIKLAEDSKRRMGWHR